MRLALKLSLLLLGASAGPLLVGTEVLLRLNRGEMREQLQVLYKQSARALAESIDRAVRDRAQALLLSSRAVDFERATEDELEATLELLYRQTKSAGVVGLFDANGKWVVPPYRMVDPASAGRADNEGVDQRGLETYARSIPQLSLVLQAKAPVIGVPYVSDDASGAPIPRVVVGVSVAGARGQRWVLAVELSLRAIANQVAELRSGDRDAYLVDQTGRAIAHRQAERMSARQDLSKNALLAGQADPRWIGWAAEAPNLHWRAVIEQPASTAFAPIAQQTRTARLLGCVLGLVVAFALGFTTVRAVTKPVHALQAAAESVAQGRLEVGGARVEVGGKDELAQLGRTFNAMLAGLLERERLKASFSRYVSEEVASRILRESSDLDLKGEQVEVTVVFVDVRGFTSFTERHAPREVVDLLNAYLAKLIDVVMKYEGVINNFMGDAVMAVFGVPREIPHPELRAVTAALEIQRAVLAFNDERVSRGLPVLEFGIGVNTGVAIAGNLGGPRRMQYTVVGDAVNLAQRLQGFAKEGEVIVSTSALEPLKDRLKIERRGAVQVKGKKLPVEIYRVVDPHQEAPPPDVTALHLRRQS